MFALLLNLLLALPTHRRFFRLAPLKALMSGAVIIITVQPEWNREVFRLCKR